MNEGDIKVGKENNKPKKLSQKIFWVLVIIAALSVIVKVVALIYSINK